METREAALLLAVLQAPYRSAHVSASAGRSDDLLMRSAGPASGRQSILRRVFSTTCQDLNLVQIAQVAPPHEVDALLWPCAIAGKRAPAASIRGHHGRGQQQDLRASALTHSKQNLTAVEPSGVRSVSL